jgi:hypothetical protein
VFATQNVPAEHSTGAEDPALHWYPALHGISDAHCSGQYFVMGQESTLGAVSDAAVQHFPAGHGMHALVTVGL